MRTIKKITTTIEVTDKVICNKCEKDMLQREPWVETMGCCCDYIGGFYSTLGDMVEYRWDICEECMKEMFATFKIDPMVKYEED